MWLLVSLLRLLVVLTGPRLILSAISDLTNHFPLCSLRNWYTCSCDILIMNARRKRGWNLSKVPKPPGILPGVSKVSFSLFLYYRLYLCYWWLFFFICFPYTKVREPMPFVTGFAPVSKSHLYTILLFLCFW